MKINNRTKRGALNRGLFIILATMVAIPLGLASKNSAKEAAEKGLVVNIDDPLAFFSVDAEWIREDLLESAFYEAARRQDLDNFEINFNKATAKDARDVLEFRVISWKRSVTNLYEFTASARYFDSDGDEIKLGVFRGYRSGIAVFNGRDVGEHFADTAEDAFRQALRKLEETLS